MEGIRESFKRVKKISARGGDGAEIQRTDTDFNFEDFIFSANWEGGPLSSLFQKLIFTSSSVSFKN